MARAAKTRRLNGVALSVLMAAATCASAQSPPMPLEEAARRNETDFSPLHEGKTVTVAGQVSTKSIRILDYVHLPIQAEGKGFVLEGHGSTFDSINPGDWVEASGRINRRGGLPVLVVTRVVTTSGGAPPLPVTLPVERLLGFERLGTIVTTEGRIVELGENAGGHFLRVEADGETVKVFLPDAGGQRLRSLSTNDGVRVTGIAYQYCVSPPYNRHFELLLASPEGIERTSLGWMMQLGSLRPFLLALFIPAVAWWWRERRSNAHREMLRRLYGLGEEVLESGTIPEISSRLDGVVPRVLRVNAVRLYLHDRSSNSLAPIVKTDTPGAEERMGEPVPLDASAGVIHTSLTACFQNRNLLDLHDTRKSPFPPSPAEQGNLPRSLFFFPMLAQGEPVGVLQIESGRRVRSLSADEKAVAQHLANQVAVAVKLLQQRSFREQLSRSEKLAAVGRLISGVVNDLQTPLASISSMAEAAIETSSGSATGHELLVIASEARRAASIVSRLVSFAQTEQVEAAPVEINQLMRSLLRFRDREWKASGIQLRSALGEEPLFVMGSQGQLEQVFLNLFVQAEQEMEEATDRWIKLRADVLGKRVFIEIAYAAPGKRSRRHTGVLSGEASDIGLEVCSSVISGHGGEMRAVKGDGRECSFEIELPWLPMDHAVEMAVKEETREPARNHTAMLLEPEEWVAKQVLETLAARGYRVVPIASSDEALDLAGRLRFDVVICSTRMPGLNWVEFFDRVRGRVGAFLLLAEAFSHDLTMHFRGEGRFVLLKPIDKHQFTRTFEAIEARLSDLEGRPQSPDSPPANDRFVRGNGIDW